MLNLAKSLKFLIIEDDELTRLSLKSMLREFGSICEAKNLKESMLLIQKKKFDIIFIDLDLEEELDGLKVVKSLQGKGDEYVVVLSGREEDKCIEQAYLNGCHDYLSKPFNTEGLELVIKKFSYSSKQSLLNSFFKDNFVTNNSEVKAEFEKLVEILSCFASVFIGGETGTGKTKVAKLIHYLAYGDMEKFVHLNCSEIPESLLESELFGHEKGAFSGADRSQKGKLELADGGTLFLDEIATMPKSLQQKLLKVIEEKKFYPLGSEKLVKSNFRLISATCEDLPQLVREGKFRQDMFFRIGGHNINLKPLRERRGDIPILIKHFLKAGQRRVVFTTEVMEALTKYSWPGNVRELKKNIEVLQSKKQGIIRKGDLPEHILSNKSEIGVVKKKTEKCSGEEESLSSLNNKQIDFIKMNGLKAFIEQKVENAMVNHFYNSNNKRVRQTMDSLKISNNAFYRIMNRVKAGEA